MNKEYGYSLLDTGCAATHAESSLVAIEPPSGL